MTKEEFTTILQTELKDIRERMVTKEDLQRTNVRIEGLEQTMNTKIEAVAQATDRKIEELARITAQGFAEAKEEREVLSERITKSLYPSVSPNGKTEMLPRLEAVELAVEKITEQVKTFEHQQ